MCLPVTSEKALIQAEMVQRIHSNLHYERITKFDVSYPPDEGGPSVDSLIGRDAHIKFLDSNIFTAQLLFSYKKFFDTSPSS